jgi:large subunit ribosomal protein L30
MSEKNNKKAPTIEIKLVKSLNGCLENQKACARALGLKKVGDVTVQPNNAATMGKVAKISHIVQVCE